MTEADERRLKERYEGGMGGLSEEAYACAPDVLWLIEQVKKYQNLHAKMTVYAEQVEHQLKATQKAKRENDERFMLERDAALKERDALREKQAVWIASPEAAARLQGYRELGDKCAALEGERDALRGALVHIAGADDQTIEEADSGAYLRDMARKAIKKEGR